MKIRSLFPVLLLLLAVPMTASQFVDIPFDAVARESIVVVRGKLGPITSAWNDSGEIIYSTAVLNVSRYIGGDGPEVLMVREVGGTVDGYTQEAVGFPELREGEEVVLFLSKWDDGSDFRIHAYNQGKFLLRNRGGVDVVIPDQLTQGHRRFAKIRAEKGLPMEEAATENLDGALTLDELTSMVREARAEGPAVLNAVPVE